MSEIRELLKSEVGLAEKRLRLAHFKLRIFDYLTDSSAIALTPLHALQVIDSGNFEALRKRIAAISEEKALEFDDLLH